MQVVPEHVCICNCVIHNVNNEQKVSMTKALLANTSMNKQQGQKHFDRDVEQFMFASFKWEYEIGRDVLKQ
jgi:hypothetical protein